MKTQGGCGGEGFLRKIVQMPSRVGPSSVHLDEVIKATTHKRQAVTGRSSLRGMRQYVDGFARVVYEQALLRTENTGPAIKHVKDGKPLTAHGAKLLGVSWPQ
jgi:hypothetical protein